MEFNLNAQQERFRSELCAYLNKNLTPELKQANADAEDMSGYNWDFVVEFRKRLSKDGYLAVGWPAEYGGGGKDLIHQTLLFEECDYHGVPGLNPTYAYMAQAIIMLGSEEQRKLLLPRIASGELDIVVGYSEPEAGSDLANLQTTAVRQGDEFIVNGQKLFQSGANHAHYAWLAVRTDPNLPKHKGIAILLVDMNSPGVTLDQYRTMSGWWHHGVVFDGVRVPQTMLVGEMNKGWYAIMAAIDFERAANASPGHMIRLYDILLQYCRETEKNGKALIDDPLIRNILADLHAEVQSSRLVGYWVMSMQAKGQYPQHETSLMSGLMRETARKISQVALNIMGPYAQLTPGSHYAPLDGELEFAYRDDMYFSFAAGGFDITRNIIARRGLGLPRD